MPRRINRYDFTNVRTRTGSLDLPVVSLLSNPRGDWRRLTRGSSRIAGAINIDWKRYNPVNYLFTHCSIVSSVATEPNGYYIKPICSSIVNANGNAWTNEVLLATFKSFIGAENYIEHCQIPSQSKGKILDAVLRPYTYEDESGEKADVYICDILVATSREHTDLIQKIESGLLTTLSMGTVCKFVTCSKCGRVFADDDDSCEHIKNELLTEFKDDRGVTRIVSEICGRMIKNPVTGRWEGDPESNKFIEASWVEAPAFKGAVINHFVEPNCNYNNERYAKIMEERQLNLEVTDLMGLRVADRYGMISIRMAFDEYMRRQRMGTIRRIADYDYVYDPEHKKNPGSGYAKTNKGWSKSNGSGSSSKRPAGSHGGATDNVGLNKAVRDLVRSTPKNFKYDPYTIGMAERLFKFKDERDAENLLINADMATNHFDSPFDLVKVGLDAARIVKERGSSLPEEARRVPEIFFEKAVETSGGNAPVNKRLYSAASALMKRVPKNHKYDSYTDFMADHLMNHKDSHNEPETLVQGARMATNNFDDPFSLIKVGMDVIKLLPKFKNEPAFYKEARKVPDVFFRAALSISKRSKE